KVLACRFLLVRIAFEVLLGWTIRTPTMFGATCSPSPLADGDTLRLVEIGGEFGRSPIGAVQTTACGALFDPGDNLRGQALWEVGGASRSPGAREPVEAPRAISIQPALQGSCGDMQVFSDLVMAPPTVGHQANALAGDPTPHEGAQ